MTLIRVNIFLLILLCINLTSTAYAVSMGQSKGASSTDQLNHRVNSLVSRAKTKDNKITMMLESSSLDDNSRKLIT